MIRLSQKRKDVVFVARTLRTYKLDPVPLRAYYDEPDYRWDSDGWERVVERYAWGAIVYCERPGDAATIVAEGAVDIATGMVTAPGRVTPEPFPLKWYSELTRRYDMNAPIDVPDCAGYWVAGVTCDGGINSGSGEHEPVCSWRRRCRLVQEHMIKLNTDPQSYRQRYGAEALPRLLERLERGKTTTTKPKKPKPQKRKPKPPPAERKRKRYASVQGMVTKFTEVLAATIAGTTNEKVAWVGRRSAAVRSGSVYVVDRSEKGVSYPVYMRIPKGRPHKLAVIRMAPINGGLDIQLPVTEKPGGMPSELIWSTWNDLPMKGVARTLNDSDQFLWMAEYIHRTAREVMESFQ
jgi:hypothetical protein